MSTGNFEDWTVTIADLGPIYPFVGSEGFLWVVGMVLWIVWHIVQSRRENEQYEEEIRRFGGRKSLEKIVSAEDPNNP